MRSGSGPLASIRGFGYRNITNAVPLILEGIATPSACGTSTTGTVPTATSLQLRWSITSGPTFPSIPASSSNGLAPFFHCLFVSKKKLAVLTLEKNTLRAGGTYVFRFTVSEIGLADAYSEISVFVGLQPLQAMIAGGSTLVSSSKAVTLASASVDPDSLDSAWSCSWTCSDPAVNIAEWKSSCAGTIPAGTLSAGRSYTFRLAVSKDSRRAVTSAEVTVAGGTWRSKCLLIMKRVSGFDSECS